MYCSRHNILINSFILILLAHTHIFADHTSNLEFESAFEELVESNFGIQAANANVWSKGGEVQQAAARPNPVLAVNLNSVGQSGCSDRNELFVGVTQLVELGGKRAARMRVADADQTVSMWDLEIQKKELFANLLNAFINVASAQERVELAKGQQKISEQILSGILQKRASGKISGLEQKKAEIAVRSAKLIASKQQAALLKARKELLSFWSTCPPTFDLVNFPLYQLKTPPQLETLQEILGNNPELAKIQAKSTKACEVVSLERAKRTPDVAFVVGVTTERFVKDPGLSVGFGVPLPIFDRNQGNISRASYEQVEAIYEHLDAYTQMKSSLDVIYGEWVAAYEQAVTLKDEVLPAAEESFQLAQESYREGKHDYLNLLDAQSTLIRVKEQYLDAIEEYHHKRAEALRLTAICNL